MSGLKIYNDMCTGPERAARDRQFRAIAAGMLKAKGFSPDLAERHEPDGRDSPSSFVASIIFSITGEKPA